MSKDRTRTFYRFGPFINDCHRLRSYRVAYDGRHFSLVCNGETYISSTSHQRRPSTKQPNATYADTAVNVDRRRHERSPVV